MHPLEVVITTSTGGRAEPAFRVQRDESPRELQGERAKGTTRTLAYGDRGKRPSPLVIAIERQEATPGATATAIKAIIADAKAAVQVTTPRGSRVVDGIMWHELRHRGRASIVTLAFAPADGGYLDAYRHYRLNVLWNNGGGRTAVAEMEFLAGDLDVAFGGTASASSTSGSADETADAAFDDDEDTEWVTGFTQTPELAYDRGESRRVGITAYSLGVKRSGDESRAPKDWQVEGSDDGVSWAVLDSQAGVTDWDTAGGTVLAKKTFQL